MLEGTSAAARPTTRDLLALISSGSDPRAAEPHDDDEPAPPRAMPHLRLVS